MVFVYVHIHGPIKLGFHIVVVVVNLSIPSPIIADESQQYGNQALLISFESENKYFVFM